MILLLICAWGYSELDHVLEMIYKNIMTFVCVSRLFRKNDCVVSKMLWPLRMNNNFTIQAALDLLTFYNDSNCKSDKIKIMRQLIEKTNKINQLTMLSMKRSICFRDPRMGSNDATVDCQLITLYLAYFIFMNYELWHPVRLHFCCDVWREVCNKYTK